MPSPSPSRLHLQSFCHMWPCPQSESWKAFLDICFGSRTPPHPRHEGSRAVCLLSPRAFLPGLPPFPSSQVSVDRV